MLLDLLGPAGGPEEEVEEGSVRDRYLVGALAPSEQQTTPEEMDELAIPDEGAVRIAPVMREHCKLLPSILHRLALASALTILLPV